MTEQLIKQAIRELHIDIQPHRRELTITPILAPETTWAGSEQTETTAYLVTGKNRKGDDISIKIDAETPYPQIVDVIKTAWRGK